MAKTYLDQVVEYPSKIILRLAEDKYCAGLILNKAFGDIDENDIDKVLDDYIKDYQYVDETTQETAAFVWVEMEVNQVDNKTIKGVRLYVTVCCHKNYMSLAPKTFKGIIGNRRDNLVRYIDKILNYSQFMGIGRLKLNSVKTIAPINGFTGRELTYEIPDFNIVEIDE